MVIRYGFHPRCGETVVVTGRYRHGDGAALTIRQPDGSLAQLPIWMTEDQAATMAVAEFPRLPLACLRELRLELDACQRSLRDEGRRLGAGDKQRACKTVGAGFRRHVRGSSATSLTRHTSFGTDLLAT